MNARARPPAVAGCSSARDAAALREDILRLLAHAAAARRGLGYRKLPLPRPRPISCWSTPAP
ncbi:MAG: hypothetical protein U1F11_06150 [Steroidobacteraceae bacterium]